MSFVLDHLFWISVGTIFLALVLVLFVVWFFHRMFPGEARTTPMASAVASLVVVVLVGFWLNNLFGLKRDRDARLWGLQQEHLGRLRPVLKIEAERSKEVAEAFHTQGFLIDIGASPSSGSGSVSHFMEPEMMSSDLRNHYPAYVSAKVALAKRIEAHNRDFFEAVEFVERESNFSDISWFSKKTMAKTFVEQCTGKGPGMTLRVNPGGGFSLSYAGASVSNTGGTASPDLVSAYKKYRNFKPSQELQNRCRALAESASEIAHGAERLSEEALQLVERTTLPGACDFVRLR